MQKFEKSAAALEFDKVIEAIAQKCVSSSGRLRLKSSRPFSETEALRQTLDSISEMREIYLADGGFPIWDFSDVRTLFAKIEPEGSFLEIEQFVKLQDFLELIAEIRQFEKKHGEKYPLLSRLIARLEPLAGLLQQFHFTFESPERIFDNASGELKSIRKELERLNSEIHIRLERIMRKSNEHIREEYMTLRDGRLVLPVREYSVTKVPGIVHGQSGSGATYFVEPMAVVPLNNDIQKAAAAERKEVVRILKRLTNSVREHQAAFFTNLELLIELDVIQAKARDANQFASIAPEIAPHFKWNLKQAKHPLLLRLHPETTVPLSLEAGGNFNELIISGPNAGGKTVALKTIGLLQLLFQSGFHIPAAEGSSMPLCDHLFAVIGDEQSIENDLSTFSSHLKLLQDILTEVADRSLVLIDEIGSGTEPGGGAALAIAVLEKLNKKGIVTVATTHQNQLKYFGAETDGVQNAAMQFDAQQLRPLFTLESGIPGSSYTFEICRRMGLDESIIARAAELSGRENFELDKLLTDVAENIRMYNEKRDALSIKQSELDGLVKLYKIKSDALSNKRKQYEKEAKEEARALLRDVNKEVERVIREIKESAADKQVVKKARRDLKALKTRMTEPASGKKSGGLVLDTLSPGQRARSVQYGISGHISKVFRGKQEVEIEKEGLKITVSAQDLEILDEDGNVSVVAFSDGLNGSEAPGVNIPNELDLRGLMTEEAIRETERYLDAAKLSNWSEVRLVHGKGTGALRLAVHQYLKGVRGIKGFRIGRWGEGDSGVTVVEL